MRAATVLTCLEGFTASLRGERRTLMPLNSAMVVTDPLPDSVWQAIGWDGAELLGDSAHAYIYAQRTADGRIALGGRGVPYRYGSRTDRRGHTQPRTIEQLAGLLHELFPDLRSVPIAHAWCGVLGVPRDWYPTVRLDRASGLGTAGGYVGHGVATSNLAGRTLRDLVLGRGDGAHGAALGWPSRPALGARAAALARIAPGLRALPRGGSARGARDVQEQRARARGRSHLRALTLGRVTLQCMCRNIRTLHNFEPPASETEVREAALQYVRKISGSTKPSQANAEAFERAVDQIAHITAHLLDDLVTTAPPKDREVEAAKRRARAAERYAA